MKAVDRMFPLALRVSGALTLTMFIAAIAPQTALQLSFGQTIDPSPLADLIIRSWGALVGSIGLAQIYAASHPPLHRFAAGLTIVTKLVFVILLVATGGAVLRGAMVTVATDTALILLLALCLIRNHRSAQPRLDQRSDPAEIHLAGITGL